MSKNGFRKRLKMSSSWEIVVAATSTESQGIRRTETMVLCASLFSQVVALFNKSQFYHLVRKHRAERYSKGCSSWDHFVAMLFGQSAQAKSLREICGGLACTIGKLRSRMSIPPDLGTCFGVFSIRPWTFVEWSLPKDGNSALRISSFPWIPRSSRFA
jgi:hypothetical protein